MKKATLNMNIATCGTPYISIYEGEDDNSAKGFAIRKFISSINIFGTAKFSIEDSKLVVLIANDESSEAMTGLKEIQELQQKIENVKNGKEEDFPKNVSFLPASEE